MSNIPYSKPGISDLSWRNSFATLGEDFYAPLRPTPLPSPYWVGASHGAATLLELPNYWNQDPATLEILCGNQISEGMAPLSSVYSGHQFGVWAGQLGDGRAILLGETGGLEIQLKGAGLTPFSRMGDGRAVLRSSIREFLCSEAMHALGIPTTRALCVTGSDAPVYREEPETAAVVTRLAPSFVRFGHFEHFCHNGLHTQLRLLADYVIDKFYPECRNAVAYGGNPYANFLQAVTERTAHMVAQWQAVGFCHGVMNTDNMSILGLTIDYGPFQFMDGFDPDHICNHSDNQGRYAFHKQPNVAYWNLFALGQALMPLIEDQQVAVAALETYKTVFPMALGQRLAAKLGFAHTSPEIDALASNALILLASENVDYTIFWRRLSHWAAQADPTDRSVRDMFLDRDGIDRWLLQFSELLAQYPSGFSADLMLKTNPYIVLRNHLGEQAIQAAKTKDFSVLAKLHAALEKPFEEVDAYATWADFPPVWASRISISCSS